MARYSGLRQRSVLWGAIAALLIAGAVDVTCAAEAGTAAAPLPAEDYGHLPRVFDAAISPDGSKVVIAISDLNGLQGYRVLQLDGGQQLHGARVDTSGREDERTVLRGVDWASDQHVTYLASATFRAARVVPANVSARVSRLDVWRSSIADVAQARDYNITRDESSDWGLQLYGLVAPIDGAPGEGRLVTYDSPFSDRRMSVFRVNLATGKARRIWVANRDTLDILLDPQGRPTVRVDSNAGTNEWSVHVLEGDTSRLLISGQSSTGAPPDVVGQLDNGDLAVIEDPGKRGRDALLAYSLRDGSKRVLIESDTYDVSTAIHDPWSHRVVGVTIVEEHPVQRFVDARLAEIERTLTGVYPGAQVELRSWSRDRARVIAFIQRASDAGGYYLYEAPTQKLKMIAMRYPALSGTHLGDRFAIRYTARDGAQIPAYLTLPSGRELAGLPLVVLVHGGPAVRDTFEFDWWASFLASRGYAVVQPNYRGSAGYGSAWQEAGYRNWGSVMQDDVEDAVTVLTRPGKADASRVCIIGGSYGGYAALFGATLKPSRYRCAASFAGVSDLPMMLRTVERVTGEDSMASDWWRMLIGDRDTEADRLEAISPAWQAQHARAPILLVHGANDVVVPIRQSERMADALRSAGREVEFIRFAGEDHWLSDAPTRVRLLQEIERFLGQHLAAPTTATTATAQTP